MYGPYACPPALLYITTWYQLKAVSARISFNYQSWHHMLSINLMQLNLQVIQYHSMSRLTVTKSREYFENNKFPRLLLRGSLRKNSTEWPIGWSQGSATWPKTACLTYSVVLKFPRRSVIRANKMVKDNTETNIIGIEIAMAKSLLFWWLEWMRGGNSKKTSQPAATTTTTTTRNKNKKKKTTLMTCVLSSWACLAGPLLFYSHQLKKGCDKSNSWN